MRIISGAAKGRGLKTISAPGFRPAMAKTREALFSMLEARGLVWEENAVLDLYAGSGSLAFECVSRGAPMAWLVDNSREACECERANAEALGMAGKCRIFDMDVQRFLRSQSPTPFSLVFIDPPYRRNLTSATLALLANGSWLGKGAFICCESEKELAIKIPDAFTLTAERNFGQTILRIWDFQ